MAGVAGVAGMAGVTGKTDLKGLTLRVRGA